MDTFGRPDWDSFYMALAFVASQRSIDPSTKHGCVIVSQCNKILSIGYNGPPRGADDAKVPLTRPDKYHFMAHAEANAIDNCGRDLDGATAYVTGIPCSSCLLRLIQRGIAKIVYGRVGSMMVDSEDARKSKQILDAMKANQKPTIVQYQCNEYASVLTGTLDYIVSKCGQETPVRSYVVPRCGECNAELPKHFWIGFAMNIVGGGACLHTLVFGSLNGMEWYNYAIGAVGVALVWIGRLVGRK